MKTKLTSVYVLTVVLSACNDDTSHDEQQTTNTSANAVSSDLIITKDNQHTAC